MTDDRNLGKELLRRNGIESAEVFRDTLREVAALLARERIARDQARARRAIWVAVVSFAVLMVLYFGRGPLVLYALRRVPAMVPHGPVDSLMVDVGILVASALCILALMVAIPIWIGTIFPGDGIAPGELPEKRRAELFRMMEGDQKRLMRMKWATVVAWSLWALLYIVGAVVERVQGPGTVVFSLVFPRAVLFWVAVVCTISWYVRSRAVTQREIQASLADLAEQVRQLVEDQKADRAKGTSAPGPEPESETKRD